MEHGAIGRAQHAASYTLRYAPCALLVCLLISGLTGCTPQQEQPTAPQDKPLASYRIELLQTAFEIATAIPVHPHIKDRSRTQEAVVTACFELDQPQRALSYIEKIGNWRKGLGFADYAFYCAENGFPDGVTRYLDLADEISLLADQDWRRDRIKVRISQTFLLLGDKKKSDQFVFGIEASESGKVEQVEASLSGRESFSNQVQQLDSMIGSRDFDITKNSLFAYITLFENVYNEESQRQQVESRIREGWVKIPYPIRIEILLKLVDASLRNADPENGLRLVNDASELVVGTSWPPEYQVPLMAQIAAKRFSCGDTQVARVEMEEALDLFNEKQSDIVNIYKADALIPLAEALNTARDLEQAMVVYKQAVEASIENPNSRPQAEDLSAICVSMAVHGVEPDDVLWNRIKELQANLGDPW